MTEPEITEPKTIWETDDLSIKVGSANCAKFFGEVLALRTQNGLTQPNNGDALVDQYSEHFVAYKSEKPVAALSVTRASRGRLVAQEFFPVELLKRFNDQVCSAFGFCVCKSSRGRSLANTLISEAWRFEISLGIRLDVIKVERRFVRFYLRLGYLVIPSFDFRHPILGIESTVLCLPVNGARKTVVEPLVGETTNAISDERVFDLLQQTKTPSMESRVSDYFAAVGN